MQEIPESAERPPKKTVPWKWISVIIVVIVVIAGLSYWYLTNGPAPVTNQPPVPSALVAKDTVNVGQTVSLDGSTSTDQDGQITDFNWTLGDGRFASGAKVNVSYAYPGSYVILLTVTDNLGVTVQGVNSLLFIKVLQPAETPSNSSAPTALIIASKSVLALNESASFDGSSSWAFSLDAGTWNQNTTRITSYLWNFGDGSTAQTAEANHSWSTPGNYPVWLQVQAKNGLTAKAYNTVEVLPPAVPFQGIVPNPHTLFKAVVWEPEFIDPVYILDYVGGEVDMNTYEHLLTWQPGDPNTLVPDLATQVPSVQNGQISADGLTYTFTIRQGVRFADGTPLTPQDVEYSIERALTINLPTSYVNPSLVNELTAGSTSPAVISNAVTVNGWNVTFHLLTPYTPFLQVIAGLDPTYVVSKNYVISHNGWDPANPSVNWSGKEDTWMERHAMGTGPYYLSEWQPSQRMVFLANPYYWRGSPTNITTVVLIIAPETSTRIALLKAGDADEADITPAYLSQISGQAGIDIISGGKTAFIHFIGFSQNINMSAVPCCDIGINATFFSDKHLRLAFNYAMPYEQYLQAAYKGYAVRYNSPIPSPLWANDPSVPLYPFNQTKAAEEFKLAWGGTLSNPGPVWQNGFTTTIYVEPNDEMLVRGQMLAQSLLQINPKFIVKTQTMDIGPETTLSIENGQPMWMYWWGGYFWDPDVDATAMMASYGWRSIQGEYYNATVDALVAQAASEPDQAKRYQLYQQVQWAAYYDVPVITCEQLLNFHVFRSWMGGYVFNPAEARQADRWAWLTKG